MPAGATALTLPDDAKVRVFAVTAATGAHDGVTPARPLYDTLADHVADQPPAIDVEGAAGAEPYHDAVRVRIEHPLYWQDGFLRYTTDGSDPVATSPAYAGPVPISARTTITARQFDAAGHAGPAVSRSVDVDDTTPPTVVSADGVGSQRRVRVVFSEPVARASAEAVANYRFDPPLTVASAKLDADGQSVELTLGGAVPPRAYTLAVQDVTDVSPAANRLRAATADVRLDDPVFTLPAYTAPTTTGPDAAAASVGLEQSVPNLPVKGSAPWTVNCFVRAASDPDASVLIAGFGKVGMDGDPQGVGRYLSAFPDGLRFWGRNRDVESDEPLDTNKWQMLSATYDGHTVVAYKNGEEIGHGDRSFADDEAVVRLAPPNPWSNGQRFQGELRKFTVWNVPLSGRALRMLWDGGRPN